MQLVIAQPRDDLSVITPVEKAVLRAWQSQIFAQGLAFVLAPKNAAPLQFGHDRPGWAELAVLEAEGATCEAGTLARTLWSAARAHPGQWAADLAPDVTRVALAGMDRRLAGQIGDDAPALCPPDVARLVYGMLEADLDAIAEAADGLAGASRLTAEAFAREELACAAAAASSIRSPSRKRSSVKGALIGCGASWAMVQANRCPDPGVALKPPVPQPQFT